MRQIPKYILFQLVRQQLWEKAVNIKIRYERLRELRRVVEAVPPEHLKMDAFSQKTECGTAYCAGGWAAIDPYFIKIGLHLEVSEAEEADVRFGIFNQSRALASCFHITRDNALALFGFDLHSFEYAAITKNNVLANIDRMLAGKEPLCYHPSNLKQLTLISA